MASALKNGINAAKSMFGGSIKTLDPNNYDSQVTRGDMSKPDSEPAVGDDIVLVNLGNQRFEEARWSRHGHSARIFSGIAMYMGRQYDYWDEQNACMMPLPGSQGRNPDFDEKMSRSKWNIVRRHTELIAARVMSTDPDVWAAPQTDTPEDKQAAQIARAVNTHCAYITKRKALLYRALVASIISTTCFIEVGWNNQAYATTGVPQANGQIACQEEQIGDRADNLMLCIDAYPDPNAILNNNDIHSGAYFIKRCTRSVEFIQQKWGKTVTATAPSGTYGFLEQRLEWIAGDRSRDMTKVKNCTDVTEVWERPSKRYKQGRFWVYTADNTMLWSGPWPFKKKDKYPFVPVRFQDNPASIWALNGVDEIRPIQIDLNDLATYFRARLQWDRDTTFVPDGANISPESMNSPALGKVVPYTDQAHGGGEPKLVTHPSPGSFYFDYWKGLLDQAEYITGARDFNRAGIEPVTSGFEFSLRVEQERSTLGPVIKMMQGVEQELMEWDIALYQQFGTSFPRLLGLDDKANPANQDFAVAALTDLRALKNGNVRVVLQPDSGQAKSPAAQEERLDKIIAQLANPNMNPALAKLYLSLSSAIRSDKQVDDFNTEFDQYYQAQAQQAASVQAQKGDQAKQQIQMKGAITQQQAQIDQQTAEVEAAIKVDSMRHTEAARATADQAVEQHRVENAAKLETLKFNNSMALLQAGHQAPPSISLTGKLGSVGTESAEKLAGFAEVDNPAEIKSMNAPVKPMGPTVKKKATS